MRCSPAEFVELTGQILRNGACLRFLAKGGSMCPSIKNGDILIIEPLDGKKNQARTGDVIFYQNAQNRIVVHRLIKKCFLKNRLIFITRGDASAGEGEVVSLEQITGRVKAIERNGRKIDISFGLGRLISVFYALASPLIIRLRRIAAGFLRYIQGFEAYRSLAKRIIKADFLYRWEPLENDGGCFLIKLLAVDKARIAGSATIKNFLESGPADYGWWISDIWVNWRYRGLGIGSHLIQAACDYAFQHRASEIRLFLFADNKPALRLYQKTGFSRTPIPEIDERFRQDLGKTCRRRIVFKRSLQFN
jgi:RimJ/RimL family protein N-acetyltransferase